MTASVTSERPGKRDRLIAGARETIYRQGFEATTIADIAEASGVPLGNVYYYFKFKDELAAAVIDSYARESRERLSLLEQQHRTPRARLKTLVRLLVSHPDQVVLYGCPRGSLCSELDKQDNDLARSCQELMHMPVAWIEQQFKAMGRRDARDLAFALLASYEGIALLTNTFRDPELMVREGRRLERWIDSLARDSKFAPALERQDWHGDWNYSLRPREYNRPASDPRPFDQPSPNLAWLCHPALTGLTPEDWDALVATLMTLHDQQRETALDEGHRPRIKAGAGTGRRPVLTLADRLLACVLHYRLGLPQSAIAALFGVRPETVNKRIRDVRQLLEQAGHTIQTAPNRLTKLDDLHELARSSGANKPGHDQTSVLLPCNP